MEYIIKIADNKEAKSLITYLRSLKFVTVIEKKGRAEAEEFKAIITKAERSRSIPFIEALEISEQWKNQKTYN